MGDDNNSTGRTAEREVESYEDDDEGYMTTSWNLG